MFSFTVINRRKNSGLLSLVEEAEIMDFDEEQLRRFRRESMARWERVILDDSAPEAYRLMARKFLDAMKGKVPPRINYGGGFSVQGDRVSIADHQAARLIKAGFTCLETQTIVGYDVSVFSRAEVEARMDEFQRALAGDGEGNDPPQP